ncbi:MAG TPA: hypothetical protein VJL58_05895, partial [Pyrinomonadaceae bacterium]|nr:hypothetical protein [Pyrinomonadaceae bacterium]
MRIPTTLVVFSLILHMAPDAIAQKKPAVSKTVGAAKSSEVGNIARVVDETLSVLRQQPSLFAESIQRMRRGRMVKVLGVAEADGVKFYKVAAPPSNFGWVQAEAV